MFHRDISPDAVEHIIREGEIIISYPDDTPFPSGLLLGFHERTPIHVVVAQDPETQLCYVVTVYHPDRKIWNDDFRTRRQP